MKTTVKRKFMPTPTIHILIKLVNQCDKIFCTHRVLYPESCILLKSLPLCPFATLPLLLIHTIPSNFYIYRDHHLKTNRTRNVYPYFFPPSPCFAIPKTPRSASILLNFSKSFPIFLNFSQFFQNFHVFSRRILQITPKILDQIRNFKPKKLPEMLISRLFPPNEIFLQPCSGGRFSGTN